MRIAIFGATSAIAREAAREWAEEKHELAVVARDASQVSAVADDLRIRGAARVVAIAADASDSTGHEALLQRIERELGSVEIALIAFGTLPDPARAAQDVEYGLDTLRVNFTSAASLMARLAARMGPGGTIAVISSVAGDRGRGSNPYYGAAKSGMSAFASALRNRHSRTGPHVLTVKPGFVETPMTAHLPPTLLFAKSRTVGRAIVRAVAQQRDVLYTPWFWRLIMLVVRLIPERIFKKLTM